MVPSEKKKVQSPCRKVLPETKLEESEGVKKDREMGGTRT